MEAQTKGEDAVEEKNALIEEAKILFEEAKSKTTFELDGREISVFAPAYYYIAITEEALGNTDDAIKAMTTALQITQLDRNLSQQQLLSRQINYGFNLARLLQVRGTDEDNKNAENLLLQIIGVNDQEINSHLNLALLYERTDRNDDALAEYKKILAMLPEEDEKSRENIQSLIDTIEQGGSNIDISNKEGVEDGMSNDNTEMNTEVEEEVKQITLLIVGGKNSESDAADGYALFAQESYELTQNVRSEDRNIDGVVVMYGGDVDKVDVRNIENTLKTKFDNVKSERNDEEVSTYNHDVVVIIGTADKDEEEVEEDVEEDDS